MYRQADASAPVLRFVKSLLLHLKIMVPKIPFRFQYLPNSVFLQIYLVNTLKFLVYKNSPNAIPEPSESSPHIFHYYPDYIRSPRHLFPVQPPTLQDCLCALQEHQSYFYQADFLLPLPSPDPPSTSLSIPHIRLHPDSQNGHLL